MVIVLGIFDLLAYAIPGSLYLTVFAYAAHRAGWIDVPTVLQLPSLLLLIALAVAAFLTGQASSPVGRLMDRINPFGSNDAAVAAREEFVRRNPHTASRRFLRLDPFALLAALEVENREAAADVNRLRAISQMLSRSVLALALGAVTALVEIFTSSLPAFAALIGILLALVAAGCLYQSATFRRWSIIRTFELSSWDDDIDARLPERGSRD